VLKNEPENLLRKTIPGEQRLYLLAKNNASALRNRSNLAIPSTTTTLIPLIPNISLAFGDSIVPKRLFRLSSCLTSN